VEHTRDAAIVEVTPKMEGRTMTLIIAPNTKNLPKQPLRPAGRSSAEDAPSPDAQ
jgi:hypothetical protein